MGIRDEDLDAGLFEAFQTTPDESALQAIQRLHQAGSSLLLRDADDGATPVLLRRDRDQVRGDARYRVIGEIARGGIGVVYKAHDQDLNRDVALKVLRPEYQDRDDVVQRFVEEAQVEGQLQHPGIVPIYGLGLQPDGRPSFVMKLIKGRTLAELLADARGDVDLLAVFEQVAQTVAYAHSRGVIHRDLKPANVMVGAFGEVQVVDWGFAKVLGQDEVRRDDAAADSGLTVVTTVRSGAEGSQSVAGSVLGTPAYMPPEQAAGRTDELDETCDVFALGAILCEILTGKPPYTGAQKDQLIAAMQSRLEPAYERLAAAAAPAELVAITRACLEPLSGDRPKHAGHVAERLAAHFASVEERARQAQLDAVAADSQAAHERYRRRRALVLAAAAMVAIAVGGGGYLWWRADHDARVAETAPEIAAALRRATRHEGERDWARAADAANVAVSLATSAGVDDGGAAVMLARFERQRRAAEEEAAQRATDEALLEELEEIRLRRSEQFTDADADAALAAAIEARWPGLTVDVVRLRTSPDAQEYAAVFDEWSLLRRQSRNLAGSDWRSLDGVARALDPDRNDLRDALVDDDPSRLLEWAASGHALDLPPALISTIATSLFDAGRRRRSEALLRRALVRHPEDSWLHDNLANVLREREGYDEAVRHYGAALARRPRSRHLRHKLAYTLQLAGDHEQAIAVWREALRREPSWTRGRMEIAESLYALGRVEESDDLFAQALAEAGDDWRLLATYATFLVNVRKKPHEAAELYRRSLEIHDCARNHINVAISLYRDDADGTIEQCQRALEWSPTPAEAADAHELIARFLQDRDQRAEAIEHFERALEHQPWHADALAGLANELHAMGRPGESIPWCDRAIVAQPDLAMPYFHRGCMRNIIGDGEGALSDLEAALDRGVDTAFLRKVMGAVLCDHLHRYDDAIEQFLLGIDRNAEDPFLYVNLGLTHNRKGDYAAAERWLDEAIARTQTEGQAYYERAKARSHLSNLEGALADLQHALVLGYRPFIVHNEIGLIRLTRNEVTQAIRQFEKSIKAARPWVRPADLAITLANRGYARHQSGDLDGALEDLLAAVRLDEQSARSYCLLANVHLQRADAAAALESYARARALQPEVGDGYPWLVQLAKHHERLPAVLRGDDEPADAPDAVGLADLALMLRVDTAGALRLYRRAFERSPELERTVARYNAACAAALAGPENHVQALAWLRALLAAEAARVAAEPERVAKNLAHWLQDPDLAPIRDGVDLDEEQRALWTDVEALLKTAEAKR